MIKFVDFKKPKGSINLAAYNAAGKQAGAICCECGALLLFPKGQPTECGSCKALQSDKEAVTHSDLVRCPECGHTQAPEELYEEGEHRVDCGNCEAEFTVSTQISYSYTSPARREVSHV